MPCAWNSPTSSTKVDISCWCPLPAKDETSSEVQTLTSKMAEEMKEVKGEVQELSEKMDLTLDDLKEGLVAATKNTVEAPRSGPRGVDGELLVPVRASLGLGARGVEGCLSNNFGCTVTSCCFEAAMAPIQQELKDLGLRLDHGSAEQAIMEKLEEVDVKIELQAAGAARPPPTTRQLGLHLFKPDLEFVRQNGNAYDFPLLDLAELRSAVKRLEDSAPAEALHGEFMEELAAVKQELKDLLRNSWRAAVPMRHCCSNRLVCHASASWNCSQATSSVICQMGGEVKLGRPVDERRLRAAPGCGTDSVWIISRHGLIGLARDAGANGNAHQPAHRGLVGRLLPRSGRASAGPRSRPE
eukprot:s3988_g4.t2